MSDDSLELSYFDKKFLKNFYQYVTIIAYNLWPYNAKVLDEACKQYKDATQKKIPDNLFLALCYVMYLWSKNAI